MPYLIGIDEAGYGPNLGPLAVAATAWHVSDEVDWVSGDHADSHETLLVRSPTTELARVDLYDRLTTVVVRQASHDRVAIADSKLLYKPGHGLQQLERAVLASQQLLGHEAATWRSLVEQATAADLSQIPWYADFDCELPIDASADEVGSAAQLLAAGYETAATELVAVAPRLVFPQEFNELVDKYGTKGAALSHASIGLLAKVVAGLNEAEPIFVACDKHGGRNRYAALLQHHFPDSWIDTLEESRPVSRYRWGGDESQQVEVVFQTRGEAHLPTALASMTAKYLRELAMKAFNAFWLEQVADLKPTAGYPVDAARFRRQIQPTQHELDIPDVQLWRNR